MGLFLTTLATLLVELLDTRLLSVLTWYHVSFLAVSLAMLGTAAGAIAVFLAEARLARDRARGALVRLATLLAVGIAVTHVIVVQLRIPAMTVFSAGESAPLALVTVILTLPFLLSGATVTIALTRLGGRIGLLYGADLLGAASGCLLIVPLLAHADIVSAALAAAAVAGAAAFVFARTAERRGGLPAAIALLCALGALGHAAAGAPLGVRYPHGKLLDRTGIERSTWNAYSYVVVHRPRSGPPFYWGRGRSPADLKATTAMMTIDGGAETPLTLWDGDPASLAWVQYDVTSLLYHLRTGDVGMIGVGGGRDVLSALWAGSRSITGIEVGPSSTSSPARTGTSRTSSVAPASAWSTTRRAPTSLARPNVSTFSRCRSSIRGPRRVRVPTP